MIKQITKTKLVSTFRYYGFTSVSHQLKWRKLAETSLSVHKAIRAERNGNWHTWRISPRKMFPLSSELTTVYFCFPLTITLIWPQPITNKLSTICFIWQKLIRSSISLLNDVWNTCEIEKLIRPPLDLKKKCFSRTCGKTKKCIHIVFLPEGKTTETTMLSKKPCKFHFLDPVGRMLSNLYPQGQMLTHHRLTSRHSRRPHNHVL